MSSPFDNSNTNHAASSMFPLRFYIHSFEAYCFNTRACTVIYNNHNFIRLDVQPAGPPPSPDYREHWNQATFSGIGNFPPPAEVDWISLDGTAHKAKVDIGAIFKDEHVLYKVPDAEIPDRSWGDDPSIFLEVNDRIISVYMRAYIVTNNEQIPGNKYSYHRTDVILAWTGIY